jgi:protein arginine N-methyltransferase 1
VLVFSAVSTPTAQLVMLRDTIRTLQYRAAIFAHARDQVVLDVGCGSGALSIFAAQAGAKHVYAIERTSVAVLARLMFKANGVEDRVTLIRGDSRSIDLPERADLLVHELFSSDALSEGVVPILDDARARLLRPGGRLLPTRLEVCCIGIDVQRLPFATERITKDLTTLEGLYGFDLSALQIALQTWDTAERPSVEYSEDLRNHLLTDESVLWDLDLSRSTREQVEAPARATLRAVLSGRLAGVLLFFRAHLDDQTLLTTTPHAAKTHWDFTVCHFTQTVVVSPGTAVDVVARVDASSDRQRISVELA